METTNLVVRDSMDFPVLSEHVAGILDSLKAKEDELAETREAIRSALLEAMVNNNVICGEVGRWNITQVVPKDIINFDTDAFIANEAPAFVEAFTKSRETSTQVNIEKLQREFPEAYAACTETSVSTVIDTDKLAKHFHDIYAKYTTFQKSTKPITLRISESKKKSKENGYDYR